MDAVRINFRASVPHFAARLDAIQPALIVNSSGVPPGVCVAPLECADPGAQFGCGLFISSVSKPDV
ncbi:MAG: hypothetical protein ACREI9_16410 [Nitrospiraceae bacterium]